MKRIFYHLGILVLALVAASQAITFTVNNSLQNEFYVENGQMKSLGNLPFEFIVCGKDTTVYTDTAGNFSVTFRNMTCSGGPSIGVNAGIGTSMRQDNPISSISISDNGTYDLRELGDHGFNFNDISVGGIRKDTVITLGRISTNGTDAFSDPVPQATIKVIFVGNGGMSTTDTVSISGNTSDDGSIVMPKFRNIALYRNARIRIAKNGFNPIDTVVSIPAPKSASGSGTLWDGIPDTLKETIEMFAGVVVPDTLDTIIVRGTIKDSTGAPALAGAGVQVSIGKDTNSFSSPKSATTDANGAYEVHILNVDTLTHVYCKVLAGAANYLTRTVKKDTSIAAPRDGKNDTVTVNAGLVHIDNPSPGDTLVVRSFIRDSSGITSVKKALVQISIGPDTNSYAQVKLDSTDTNGMLEVSIANTGKIDHIYCKVSALATNFALTTLQKDTIIASRDWKRDTVVLTVKMKKSASSGDTLVVRGIIRDSLSQSSIKPDSGAIVKISLGVDGLTYIPVGQCTTQVAGAYAYKLWNSVKASHVYSKIEVIRPNVDSTTKRDFTIVPDDYKNDTLVSDIRIVIPTGITNPFALWLATVGRQQVSIRIYSIAGRLIAHIPSSRTGFRSDVAKYFRENQIRSNACLVTMSDKTGTFQKKMMINLQ